MHINYANLFTDRVLLEPGWRRMTSRKKQERKRYILDTPPPRLPFSIVIHGPSVDIMLPGLMCKTVIRILVTHGKPVADFSAHLLRWLHQLSPPPHQSLTTASWASFAAYEWFSTWLQTYYLFWLPRFSHPDGRLWTFVITPVIRWEYHRHQLAVVGLPHPKLIETQVISERFDMRSGCAANPDSETLVTDDAEALTSVFFISFTSSLISSKSRICLICTIVARFKWNVSNFD